MTFLKGLLRVDAPLVVIIVLVTIAVWWWRRPTARGPRRLLLAFVAAYYVAATPLGANVLVAGIGHGYGRIMTAEQARGADAIVVLAGGVQTLETAGVVLSQLPLSSALRILEAARVYRLIHARYVIVSGGIADEKLELRPEGEQMATALAAVGVPADRILLDLAAKTTHDHPRTVRPILDAHRIRQFVLVTSPTHMRRAMAVFRAAGFDPVPSVSLLRSEHRGSPPLFLPNDDSLFQSDEALYEYVGWVVYRARGWLK